MMFEGLLSALGFSTPGMADHTFSQHLWCMSQLACMCLLQVTGGQVLVLIVCCCIA